MCVHDIAATLQDLNVIDMNTAEDVVLSLDIDVLDRHMSRVESSKHRLTIDEECLRWTPVISTHSPLSSPDKSSSSPEKITVMIHTQTSI